MVMLVWLPSKRSRLTIQSSKSFTANFCDINIQHKSQTTISLDCWIVDTEDDIVHITFANQFPYLNPTDNRDDGEENYSN